MIDLDLFLKYKRVAELCKKLFKRQERLDIRKYMFGNRIIDKWNSPPGVVLIA